MTGGTTVVGADGDSSDLRTEYRIGEISLLVVAAVLALLVPILAIVDIALPGRTVLVLLYVVLVPGVPLAALLDLPDRRITAVLAIGISLSTALLTALVQVKIEFWVPILTSILISTVSILATVWLVRRSGGPAALVSPRSFAPTKILRPIRFARTRAVSAVILTLAIILWFWETRVIDLDSVGEYGIVSALSWRYFLSLLLVLSCFVLGICRADGPDHLVAAGSLTALTVVMYHLVSVADGGAVVGTGWVHVGFIDYIGRNHSLPPSLDARFSWSGFFDAAAVFVHLAGLSDASSLLIWSPLFFTILVALPVYIIGSTFVADARIAWLGVAIYLCGNWFQQDYFSPQALVTVLYLTILSVLLWCVNESPLPGLGHGTVLSKLGVMIRRIPGRHPQLDSRKFLILELVLILFATAMVVSHQLTPVLLVVSLTLLTVLGLIRYRSLFLIVAVIFVWWLSYGAPDYWTGHLHVILGDFGQVGTSFQAAVGSRVTGEDIYHRMQLIRIAWTAILTAVAAIGWFLIRRRPVSIAAAALVLAPFTLIFAQSYGGEIVLRCFVYAMPVLAPLAAVGIGALLLRKEKANVVALIAVLFISSVLLTVTRGLNTAFERNPADVVAAAKTLLDNSKKGTTLLPSSGEGVVRMSRVGEVVWPEGGLCAVWTLDCVSQFTADYIFLSTSQQESLELQWLVPQGWLWDFGHQLVDSGMYRVKDQTNHYMVLERVALAPSGGR